MPVGCFHFIREKSQDRFLHRSIINQKHLKFSILSTEDGASFYAAVEHNKLISLSAKEILQ